MTRYRRTQNYIKLINNEWTSNYWNIIINNLDKDLSWSGLSANSNITLDIIENNLELPWKWDFISKNPNLTSDFFLKYINKDWNWYDISQQSFVTIDLIKSNIHLNWDWDILSEIMSLDIIENNLEFPWDWDIISCNKNININFILKYKDQQFNWKHLSCHKNITIENILDTIYILPWKWTYISFNPNITIDFIKQYKNKINWDTLSLNNYINLDIIDNNFPWNFDYLSGNTNLTYNFINKHINKNWNWNLISQNINILDSDKINYNFFSFNKNLTEELIKNNLNKNWNILGLILNEHISISFLFNYFNNYDLSNISCRNDFHINQLNLININWKYFSGNHLIKCKEQFIERKILEYMAAYKIQQWYNKVSIDIKYKFARNRIYNSFIINSI